jgi:hypothetical protein
MSLRVIALVVPIALDNIKIRHFDNIPLCNCFLHLGINQKVQFDKFEIPFQVFIHFWLAPSTSCVVIYDIVLYLEYKQGN